MGRNINRIKLYVKNTDKARNVHINVKNALLKHKFELNEVDYDLLISIGGDGSFLKMLRANNYDSNVFYAGINAGSLGFLTSIESVQVDSFIESINNNDYLIKDVDLLKVVVYSNNEIKEFYCINEFTLRKNDFSTMKADVLINNQLLENFSGDGLLFNTPTGSTAYNQALGGAIIDNDIKAFSMIPIAPINNKVYHAISNTTLLSKNKKITIIPKSSNNLCYLTDGLVFNDENIEKIECFLDKSIKVIFPSNDNFVSRLKSKIINSGD